MTVCELYWTWTSTFAFDLLLLFTGGLEHSIFNTYILTYRYRTYLLTIHFHIILAIYALFPCTFYM